jgi:hypothetical protein
MAPISVFGTRVYLCSADVGEELTFPLNPFGRVDDSVYYIFEGAFAAHVMETGEVLANRTAGFINTNPAAMAATAGSVRVTATGAATKWACVQRRHKAIPDLKKFELLAGQQVTLQAGARIFIIKGELQTTAGVVSPAECLAVESDTQVTASTDVRGLDFTQG